MKRFRGETAVLNVHFGNVDCQKSLLRLGGTWMPSHKIRCLCRGVCRDTWAAGASFTLKPVGTHRIAFCLPAVSAGLAPSGSCSPHKREAARWWRGPFSQQSTAWQPELLHLHMPLRAHMDIYSCLQLCTFILDKTSEQWPTLPVGLVQPWGHPRPPEGHGTPPASTAQVPPCFCSLPPPRTSATASPHWAALAGWGQSIISTGVTKHTLLGQGSALSHTVSHTKASQMGLLLNRNTVTAVRVRGCSTGTTGRARGSEGHVGPTVLG